MDEQKFIDKERGFIVYVKEGVVTWAYVNDGATVFPIYEHEKTMTPEQIFEIMQWLKDEDKFRCTSCNGTFQRPPAGRPLFAGINCETCWKSHQDKVAEQRRTGQVCRMCGQPRLLCCC